MFVCRTCGGVQARWQGKCPDCGAWDALEEHRVDKAAVQDPQRGAAAAWAIDPTEGAEAAIAPAAVAKPIAEVGEGDAVVTRLATGIGELDRVLGGGLVPGSVTLIGGDPGIGKSTLLLQVAGSLAGAAAGTGESGAGGARVLYVTSEESADQLRLRAERLGVAAAPELFVLADTNLSRIIEQARRSRPRIMVIDSIQMVYKADLDASPGSVAQLRRCCAELVYLAKLTGIAVILVGHVTKDGQLAGPRLLEHLVDTVLYFEGDRYHAHRIVRAIKNRFGSTLELGIFEMTGFGLAEAPGGLAAGVLDDGLAAGGRPGSVICPVLAGSRCVLVELQALTATGFLGAAKRKASGVDPGRLAMLIAVLEQHAGLRLADRDIFASSVGGIRVAEPAADLALLLAIAGAHYKRGLAPAVAAVGEVGLGGEVRPVPQLGQRIREAQRLGLHRVIAPAAAARDRTLGKEAAAAVIPVRTIGEAIEHLG